ncbi:E3 SUMO-protein ligase RanBP2-like [Ischnura elegans]|uniref:E3 SUMO-protein ligase RanBP2-like n=1 Tax=Ischnura elegans TaxID=197161 RepID=UPI001ED88C45|nr:E3 SUMO-protein ligase RanBP2-like [Ischnura elegans]
MTEQGPLPVLNLIRRNTLTLGSIERHSSISYEHYASYQPYSPQISKLLALLFDSKSYLGHRKNILAAKSLVDDKPPKIDLDSALNFKKFQKKINEQVRIDQGNKELLQGLNRIHRSKATVDCWNTSRPEISRNRYIRLITNNAIMKENIDFCTKLLEANSIYSRREMLEDYKRKEKQRRNMCKYPPYWEMPQVGPGVERTLSITGLDTQLTRKKGSKFYMSDKRPRCFLDFKTGDFYLGRIVVELYYDFVPVTAENFAFLCYDIKSTMTAKERKYFLKSNEKLKDVKNINYKGCLVHRILPGYYLQTGDIISKSGIGGYSVYGPVFPDENFKLKHSQRGVLSMANKGPNTNNSQFIITFKKLDALDGSHVVFGRVVRGFKTLDKIEELGTRSGCPREYATISNCGVIGFKKYFQLSDGTETSQTKRGHCNDRQCCH